MTITRIDFYVEHEAVAFGAYLDMLAQTAELSVNGTLVPFNPDAGRNLAPGGLPLLRVCHSGRRGSVRRSDNQVNFTFWDETDADRI
jgi:hypothetical protein